MEEKKQPRIIYLNKMDKGYINYENIMNSLIAIGAGIAVLTGLGAGIGIGVATNGALGAIARQPEEAGNINKTLLLGCALAEATSIYGLVVAILLIVMK